MASSNASTRGVIEGMVIKPATTSTVTKYVIVGDTNARVDAAVRALIMCGAIEITTNKRPVSAAAPPPTMT
jgi:hypothetical protein